MVSPVGNETECEQAKSMIVSKSCTIHPLPTTLTLDGTVLKESADLVILGVTFDAKMTFEKHLRCVSPCPSSICSSVVHAI